MKPTLQIALDFVNLNRAVKVAQEAVAGGADWLEVGTPLLKSEGLEAIRTLRKKFPRLTLVADAKTMDAGRIETEAAAKAGADIICVLGLASDSTIKECVEAGKNYGIKVAADLIEVSDLRIEKRAKAVEKLGVDIINVHCPIDEQMRAKDPFARLRRVAKAVTIPLSCAGGINSETAAQALKSGAQIVVVGGAVTKAKDPKKAVQAIKRAMATGKKIKTDLFKRVGPEGILTILKKVSTANLSDAMHRSGELKGIFPLVKGIKTAGPALTVRTYPGDWAKPVQAIDQAAPGDVIVIDAGGVGPAVWGELATTAALQRKLAGVVIDGAIRDSADIGSLKFGAFAKLVSPTAGEPKGFGEIGVCVTIAGRRVCSGDWIVGDDDGLVVIPKEKAVEIANRAMSVLEQENRLREEIKKGSTLGKVIELLRWEKKR